MEKKNETGTQTRQLQLCLLGILKAIDRVCREHQLTYYLLAGSCLGAVRHRGFIPWDDDADVGLPRPDYDRLVEHADEWLPEGYELVSYRQNPHYPYPFARIQDSRTTYILRRHFDFVGGLPVDVYPIDGMTEAGWSRRCHYLRLGIAKKLLYFCLVDPYKHGHGLHSLLPLAVRKIWRPQTLHRRIDAIQREYDYERAPFVADHDYKARKGIFSKDVIGRPTTMTFEDTELSTVAKTDDYLRQLYGDYMQLPKNRPPQNFRMLDLDKPYRQYVAEGRG